MLVTIFTDLLFVALLATVCSLFVKGIDKFMDYWLK